jgi:hypothetical protein
MVFWLRSKPGKLRKESGQEMQPVSWPTSTQLGYIIKPIPEHTHLKPEDGGNVGTLPQNYMVSQLIRKSYEKSATVAGIREEYEPEPG